MTTKDNNSKRTNVRFNVGGTHYEVSRDTLERCEGSMLANLISEQWKEGNTNDSAPIFIDRNGFLFQYVVDYLRTNKCHLPPSVSRAAVKEEFDYYGIDADMANVSEKYGHMYLRELKKRINEARAIQASTFVENESYKEQLPASIFIPSEYVPFDTDTLRECSQLEGLSVTFPTSNSRYSREVTVKEIAR